MVESSGRVANMVCAACGRMQGQTHVAGCPNDTTNGPESHEYTAGWITARDGLLTPFVDQVHALEHKRLASARREAALQAEVVRLREALEGLNVGARHEFEWVEDARRPGVVNAVCKPDCAKCHAEALLAHDVVVPPGAALKEDA